MAGRFKKILGEGVKEIIYVTIGILIALQINNRNDQRKGKRELASIISIVKHDLELNVAEAKATVESIQVKTQLLETVFDTTISEDSVFNCTSCFVLNTNFRDLSIRDRGLNLLRNFRANNHVATDSTILSIDAFYTIFINSNNTISDLLHDDVVGTINYYRDHFDWYPEYVQGRITEPMMRDILSNTTTRNRLIHHKLLLESNYGMMLQLFIQNGEQLLTDLNQ